tara:strand:+ start:135 stop:644 length:510 start_codon:yes stop_codon:yes gene_type:complete
MIFTQHNIWILIIYLLGIVTITIITVFVSQKFINKNSNVSSLQNSIKSQKSQLCTLETNVNSQKTQLDSQKTQLDSQKTQLDSLETQLDSLESKVNSQETEIENSLKIGEDMALIYNSTLDQKGGSDHQQWRLMDPKACNNSVCEIRFAGGISPQDPGGWYIHRPNPKS